MRVVSYNKELEIANLQFKRLFNNISIYRNGEEVPFKAVLGNRSRIFKALENPSKTAQYKLPLIIVTRTGIQKNDERLSNINNEIKYRVSSSKPIDYNLLSPVPIDISYTVTIISKYQSDIDMCLSNFIPFFNKDLFVRCEHPKFENLEYNSQIVMDGTVSEEHPEDLDSSDDDIVTASATFTFKTYIFGGTSKASGSSSKRLLSTYISTYYDPVLSTEISSEISTVIDTEYDGFVPEIGSINYGFYPVPLLSQYNPHIEWVDSLCANGYDESPYVDRMLWKIDESGNLYTEKTPWTNPEIES